MQSINSLSFLTRLKFLIGNYKDREWHRLMKSIDGADFSHLDGGKTERFLYLQSADADYLLRTGKSRRVLDGIKAHDKLAKRYKVL